MLKPGAKPPPMPAAGDEKLQEYLRKHAEDLARDFADLCHYKSDNAAILKGSHPKAVFMGDSITEGWGVGDPSLFSRGVVDRGISGQTSPQMLCVSTRMSWHCILRPYTSWQARMIWPAIRVPAAPTTSRTTFAPWSILHAPTTFKSILASIPPAERFPWRPDIQPVEQIRQLNAWLKQFAGRTSADIRRLLCSVDDTFRRVSP